MYGKAEMGISVLSLRGGREVLYKVVGKERGPEGKILIKEANKEEQ